MQKVAFFALAFCAVFGVIWWGFGLPGMRESSEPSPPESGDVRQVEESAEVARPDWLGVNSRVAPDLWLASYEAGKALPATAPQVAEAAQVIDEALKHFSETPRMIANRAVQMDRMLREEGAKEGPLQILRDLTAVVGARERKVPFSEICQHYYNSRVNGLDRQAALDALAARYRPQ